MELKWKLHSPTWLKKKYDGYDDEIWVKYWKKEWQEIIYSGGDSYTQRILSSGFNGFILIMLRRIIFCFLINLLFQNHSLGRINKKRYNELHLFLCIILCFLQFQ